MTRPLFREILGGGESILQEIRGERNRETRSGRNFGGESALPDLLPGRVMDWKDGEKGAFAIQDSSKKNISSSCVVIRKLLWDWNYFGLRRARTKPKIKFLTRHTSTTGTQGAKTQLKYKYILLHTERLVTMKSSSLVFFIVPVLSEGLFIASFHQKDFPFHD